MWDQRVCSHSGHVCAIDLLGETIKFTLYQAVTACLRSIVFHPYSKKRKKKQLNTWVARIGLLVAHVNLSKLYH